MVVVRLVAESREPVSEAVSWHPQKMSCPAEILSDDEVFQRRESCPLENFYVVTLSCHLIFMIDHRCLIMKACTSSHASYTPSMSQPRTVRWTV